MTSPIDGSEMAHIDVVLLYIKSYKTYGGSHKHSVGYHYKGTVNLPKTSKCMLYTPSTLCRSKLEQLMVYVKYVIYLNSRSLVVISYNPQFLFFLLSLMTISHFILMLKWSMHTEHKVSLEWIMSPPVRTKQH